MTPRLYKDSDYASVVSWWLAHKWPLIPQKALPKTGFIVDGVCACFVYRTDSAIAVLEFIVANPKVEKTMRSKALNSLLEHAAQWAKAENFATLFTTASHDGLINRLTELDFKITDKNVTHLMRTL